MSVSLLKDADWDLMFAAIRPISSTPDPNVFKAVCPKCREGQLLLIRPKGRRWLCFGGCGAGGNTVASLFALVEAEVGDE